MSDERLQILKMVQEGKVSAEEATRLLDALGNEPKASGGPKASQVRLHLIEGRKVSNLSIGLSFVQSVLSLPMIRLGFGEAKLDAERLSQWIDSGATGKVMEFAEENRRLEVWLDP